MASKLQFHPLVGDDIAQSLDWYDEISVELGNRFRSALQQALKDIKTSPARFPLIFEDGEIRYRRVIKFPYLVLYKLQTDSVHIRGIVHLSSDPQGWRERADN